MVTGVERTDELSVVVGVAVVVVVVVVVDVVGTDVVGGVVAPSAASRFLASFAIRSELSPPPAPGNLNPPMPPNRFPTLATGSASAGVPSALGGALASGSAAAK